jgi:hypothetical protein
MAILEYGLNFRQQKFVVAWLGEAKGNGVKAAEIAGYAFPNVDGSRVLDSVRVQAAIEAQLSEVSLESSEILERLSDHATSDIGDFLDIDDDGNAKINWKKARAADKTKLVKRVRPTKEGLAFELHDAQNALVHLGKYRKLFTDRKEIERWDRTSIPMEVAVEAVERRDTFRQEFLAGRSSKSLPSMDEPPNFPHESSNGNTVS